MTNHYVKIAWRNIIKNRVYSFVNILGLSTGIAFALIIAAYVWNELQVNSRLKNADRQCIIQSKWKDPNEGYYLATLGPLAKALRDQYPNLVANYYRYDGVTSNVSKNHQSFRENIQIGDSTLLTMYGFPLLHGNPKTALREPFTAVISMDKALKYFGKTDVVGQTVTIENFSGSKHDFAITGVLNDIPKNSITSLIDAYPGAFYVSEANLGFFGRNMTWQNPFIANYIELQKGVTPKDLEKPIARLVKENAPPQTAADLTPYVTTLHDFYLSANNGLVRKMLYALSTAALFILIMAIINYINMSVGRSAARMREIGIRKVLGSLQRQLIVQFIVESVIIVFFATATAFAVYALAKDFFNQVLLDKIPSLTDFPLYFVSFPALLVLLLGFVAGIYPAFILSSLKAVTSLKGKLSPIREKTWLQKSLTTFQFVTATVAFVAAIIISKQINLFLRGDLGYNKDYILCAQLPRDWSRTGVNKMENIRNEFGALRAVRKAALSYEIPDGNNSGSASVYRAGTDSSKAVVADALTTDENYLSVYKIPLLAGSFFEGHGLDSGKVILNLSAVQALGWKGPEEAVGQQLRAAGSTVPFTVIGVTNDFHFRALQLKIAPTIFFNVEFAPIYRYLSFKINAGNIQQTVHTLEKKWSALMPGAPFEYKFLDDTLSALYKSEIQLKKAAYIATTLALIIVLLGVLGLISLSVQKRTKEIAIRKVLGSSVREIITLFMKEFLLVIFIGGALASPLAYIIMRNWLQNYAYRINITVQPFILSIFCLGFMTTVLICLQTTKAAMTKPAQNLRTE